MLIPTRKRMARSGGWSPSWIGTCCCTFTAQRTAPSMLSNTMSRESPPVWTILPPCSSIAGSIRSRAERTQTFERSGVIQADQAAVANHVGIDHGDQLPPIWRSFSRVRCVGH